MKHKGKNYVVVTFSLPIGKENITSICCNIFCCNIFFPMGNENVTKRYYFPLFSYQTKR